MSDRSRISPPIRAQRCHLLFAAGLLILCSASALSALSALPALATAVPVRVARAVPNAVRYERRDYALQILPSGDVSVVEHWQLHFTGGPFSFASLAIYLTSTAGIDFGPIAGANAGTQQVTFASIGDNRTRKVTWHFPPTRDASRVFDIPYMIHGALDVDHVERTGLAWLDWHFLTARSLESFEDFTQYLRVQEVGVDESTITVTLPAATKASDLHIHATESTSPSDIHLVDATTVWVHVQYVHPLTDGPLEMVVVFPRSELKERIQLNQFGAAPPTPPTRFDDRLNPPRRFIVDPTIPPISQQLPLWVFTFFCGILAVLVIRNRVRKWKRQESARRH